MDIQQQLEQILNFSADDLVANEQHQFSEAQHADLIARARLGWGAFGAVFGMMGFSTVCAFITEPFNTNLFPLQGRGSYIAVIVIMLLVVMVVGAFILYDRYAAHVELKQGVHSISGTFTIVDLPKGDIGYAQVGEKAFLLTQEQFFALKSLAIDKPVTAYYKPHSQQILSVRLHAV